MVIFVVSISLISITTQITLKIVSQTPLVYILAKLFDVDGERNIPALYSSISLLFCSVLLAAIAFINFSNKARYTVQWLSLSCLFLLFAWDEAVQLHEELTNVPFLSEILRILGIRDQAIFNYTWVVAGVIFIFFFTIAYFKFFLSFPFRTKRLLLVSGGLFVFGALAMEMIGGSLLDNFGIESLVYIGGTHIEEFCEMLGIALFVYTLLLQLRLSVREVNFVFENKRTRGEYLLDDRKLKN
ncbi:hypothetical protein [Lyngbya aestuarii]|uniref:hypothetical protein n=1 Tax=Lyngbya aestuarii TaxID=118322 RepID=UPI00403D91E5